MKWVDVTIVTMNGHPHLQKTLKNPRRTIIIVLPIFTAEKQSFIVRVSFPLNKKFPGGKLVEKSISEQLWKRWNESCRRVEQTRREKGRIAERTTEEEEEGTSEKLHKSAIETKSLAQWSICFLTASFRLAFFYGNISQVCFPRLISLNFKMLYWKVTTVL